MGQGQQTVQYLRQPNGQLIPIGVAPPIAMSSSATSTNTSTAVDQNPTEKVLPTPAVLDSTKSQKPTTPSTLLAVTSNSSLTTTVTLPSVTTTPSVRAGSATPQLIPPIAQQQNQAVSKNPSPSPLVPQTIASTPVQMTPLTQPPKQQFQTIQLSWENHQKLAKVQEELKKLQGHKLSDKQMKQLHQLQSDQQKILSEGKPVSVVPSTTNSDSQLSVSTSIQQITNNQYVNISSTQSIVQSQQPVMVQTQAGAPTSAVTYSSASSSITAPPISSVSSTSPLVRPIGGPQVLIGATSAVPTSQQNVSITIGPRMPGMCVLLLVGRITDGRIRFVITKI